MMTKDKGVLVELLDEVQATQEPSRGLDTKLDFYLGDYHDRFRSLDGARPKLKASGEFIEIHHEGLPPIYVKSGQRTGSLNAAMELFNQVWKSEDTLRYYVNLDVGDEPSARVMYRMQDLEEGRTYIGSLNDSHVPGPSLERAVIAATIESVLTTQDTVRSNKTH